MSGKDCVKYIPNLDSSPTFGNIDFLRWLLTQRILDENGNWGIIFSKYNELYRLYPPNDPEVIAHEQGLGFETWSQPLVQLLFALDEKNWTFDAEPDPFSYTNKKEFLPHLLLNHPYLESVKCGSGADDLLRLILNHPEVVGSEIEQKIKTEFEMTELAIMMGCISISSAFAFAKVMASHAPKIPHIYIWELSRTISELIIRASKYFKTREKLGITFRKTLLDIGSDLDTFTIEFSHLMNQYLGRNLVIADMIEYYMSDQQVIQGLGPRLRLLGQNGLVLIRALAQYEQIPQNKRMIPSNSQTFNLPEKQQRLLALLNQAGYTVTSQELFQQTQTMFPSTEAPLRGEYMEDLFYEACEKPHPQLPSLKPVFTARVAKEGMDPEQRHYVLFAYEAA